MFEGSQNHDHGYFEPLQRAGGTLNGSTSTDRTNYWEVVPTSAIELALWMESDRMGYLLPALTEEKFQNQRDVVLNERRQNYENRPYGLAGMAISEAMFPPHHPYHWLTIGSPEDLQAMNLDEVQAFFRTYYHPANASLAIAGNLETERAFELAEAYFGEIPAGPVPAVVQAEASLSQSANLVFEDRVELPRLYINWHSPALFAVDDAELDLAGDVLSHGKTSRLYRELVFDRRVATSVSASQHSRELGGMFQIACTAAAGVTLQILADAVFAAVRELGRTGPTEQELSRALAQTEAQFVYRLQTIGDFGGKSDQLNAYNVYRGDPGYFDADRSRYRRATTEHIARAVSRWVASAPYVALCVVPRGRRDLALAGATEVHVS